MCEEFLLWVKSFRLVFQKISSLIPVLSRRLLLHSFQWNGTTKFHNQLKSTSNINLTLIVQLILTVQKSRKCAFDLPPTTANVCLTPFFFGFSYGIFVLCINIYALMDSLACPSWTIFQWNIKRTSHNAEHGTLFSYLLLQLFI